MKMLTLEQACELATEYYEGTHFILMYNRKRARISIGTLIMHNHYGYVGVVPTLFYKLSLPDNHTDVSEFLAFNVSDRVLPAHWACSDGDDIFLLDNNEVLRYIVAEQL